MQLGHRVHLLHNSGHWVHTDNPAGLLELLAPTLDVRAIASKRTAMGLGNSAARTSSR
jgi:hypothetical protein